MCSFSDAVQMNTSFKPQQATNSAIDTACQNLFNNAKDRGGG